MTPEIMIMLSILFAALVEWIPMEIIPCCLLERLPCWFIFFR
jgi:hypothetical protein